jgi:hypothetical protein
MTGFGISFLELYYIAKAQSNCCDFDLVPCCYGRVLPCGVSRGHLARSDEL